MQTDARGLHQQRCLTDDSGRPDAALTHTGAHAGQSTATPLPPSIAANAPGKSGSSVATAGGDRYDPTKIGSPSPRPSSPSGGHRRRVAVSMNRAGLTEQVVAHFRRRLPSGGTIHIEDIQDQVELALMRSGEHKVARSYVLYREERVPRPRREGRP